MNTIQRIAKNTIVLIIGDLATAVIGFFFIIYVARYLGTEGFGVLSFALAFTAIFNVLTDIGLSTLTTREVARKKSLTRKYLGNIFTLKMILAVTTFGLIALVINLMDYPAETVNVVYLIAISVFLSSFNLMFYSIFHGFEKMEFVTIGKILQSAMLLTITLIAITQGAGIITIALIYLEANLISLIYSFIISALKFAKPSLRFDVSFWKETLWKAWPFGLTLAFSAIYYWIDSVMLSMMAGEEAVGWYNAAYRMVLALLFIPSAYCRSIYPVMSRYFISAKNSLSFALEKSVKYMIIIAVPICIGTTLLAKDLILLLFGNEYYSSILALQILIWTALFIFISTVFTYLFNSIDKQAIVTAVSGSGALLNISLNWILIPRYSYAGAGIATVLTELLVLAAFLFLVHRNRYRLSGTLIIIIIKIIISASIMGIAIYYLQDLTVWLLIPLGALLYFVSLFAMRGLDKEDVMLVKMTFRK